MDAKFYVNQTRPEEEVEGFVNQLIADGWVISRTEREAGSESMTFKEFPTLTKLQNGLNKLCQEGYQLINYSEKEDPLGVDPPKYLVEAWKTQTVWRVEAWKAAGRLEV